MTSSFWLVSNLRKWGTRAVRRSGLGAWGNDGVSGEGDDRCFLSEAVVCIQISSVEKVFAFEAHTGPEAAALVARDSRGTVSSM